MWPSNGLSIQLRAVQIRERRPNFRPGLRRAREGMRLLLDENISALMPGAPALLRAQGHDPLLATGVGLLSATHARVFIAAITQALPVLTPGF